MSLNPIKGFTDDLNTRMKCDGSNLTGEQAAKFVEAIRPHLLDNEKLLKGLTDQIKLSWLMKGITYLLAYAAGWLTPLIWRYVVGFFSSATPN